MIMIEATMTTTPMTFEQWFKSSMVDPSIGIIETDPKSIAESAWQASQAQQASEIEALKHDLYSYMEASNGYVNEIMKQAQTIAELVEALEEVAPSLVIASDHYYDLHGSESPLANKYNELHVKLHALITKVKGK